MKLIDIGFSIVFKGYVEIKLLDGLKTLDDMRLVLVNQLDSKLDWLIIRDNSINALFSLFSIYCDDSRNLKLFLVLLRTETRNNPLEIETNNLKTR